MPKIPIYTEQVGFQPGSTPRLPPGLMEAPGTLLNPKALSEGSQAQVQAQFSLAKSFDAIDQMGEAVAQIGSRMMDIQQTAAMNRSKAGATKELIDHLNTFKDRNDYQNFEPEFKAKVEEIKGKYRETLMGPYQAKFDADFDSDALQTYPKVLGFSREKAKDDLVESLATLGDEKKIIVANSNNPAERQRHILDFNFSVDDGIRKGVIDKVDGYKLKKKFQIDVLDAEVLKSIQENPEKALEKLKDPSQFSDLDPGRRLKYQEVATTQAHKYRVERDQAQSDAAYQFLWDKYQGDPLPAVKFLQDPDKVAVLGINGHQAQSVMQRFESQHTWNQHIQTEQKKEDAKKEVDGIYAAMLKGRAAEAVRLTQQAKSIDNKDKFQIIESLKKDTSEKETDPMAYVILEERALRNDLTPTDILKDSRISKGHKAQLLNKLYQKMDQGQREWEKEAKDYVKSQIITTGMLGNPIPAEWDRVYRAYEGIDTHADRAKKAGKPWGIKEYMDYAKQLSDVYRTTPQTKIQDMQRQFTPPTRTALPTARPMLGGSSTRRAGESIDAYLRRTGQ